MAVNLPPTELLRELFCYDPLNGGLYWRVDKGRAKAGDIVGNINSNRKGYRITKINGQVCLVHRLVYKWVTGEEPGPYLDHVDGNSLNNAFHNLEAVTNRENVVRARKDNGLPVGVRKKGNRYIAGAHIDGRGCYIGMYTTPELAHAAYLEAVNGC